MKNIDIVTLKEKLEKCRSMPLSEINPDDVDDITDIKISKKKSSNERVLDFLMSVKNPYVFKVNGRLVKIAFSNNDRIAEECITKVIKSIYR